MLRRLESVFKDERKNFSKIFFWIFLKSVFRFLWLTDQHFIQHFWDLLYLVEKLMAGILIVSSEKLAERNTLIFKEKGWKRPSLDAPAPRGFYLCRHQWVDSNLLLVATFPNCFSFGHFYYESLLRSLSLIKRILGL